jgi:hypothetical protein
MRLSPEINLRGEPSSLSDAGAAPGISDTWTHPRAWSRRGRRTWRMIIGFPGNVGDPASSLKMTGSGATGTANSRTIRRPRVCGRTGTKCRRSKVSPSEGNEARREGSQEVTASHSSREAGERPFRTPWSEGDAALWTGSWNHAEVTVPHQRVTAKRPGRARDSDTPQRDEPDALMCTSGSVGAPGITPSLLPTSQLLPACDPGPNTSQAHARSYIRWRPIQRVCVPGSLCDRST